MLEKLVFPVLLVFFTALITWIFSVKKSKLQLKSTSIDNELKTAKYYQDLLDDLYSRLDLALKENAKLRESNKRLVDLNTEILEELRKYKQLNGKSK